MSALRTAAVVVAAILVLSATALVLAVDLFDPNDYRGAIASEVQRATGRALDIQGQIQLSILPRPRLSVTNVSLANVPGGSAPAFVSIDAIHADIALRPLIWGQFNIVNLEIDGLDVILEVDQHGQGNWAINTASSLDSGSSFTGPAISTLLVRWASITFLS
tara:strand:- start:4023 stop:4508 length:486 start_codon:yes stop_codon:yes gene_type:complete